MKLNPTRLTCTSKNNFESQRDIMGFTLKERGSDYFYELFYHLPNLFGTDVCSGFNKGFLTRSVTTLWKALPN